MSIVTLFLEKYQFVTNLWLIKTELRHTRLACRTKTEPKLSLDRAKAELSLSQIRIKMQSQVTNARFQQKYVAY